MHLISNKKLIICLVSIFVLVTCTSCKAEKHYTVNEYLSYIAEKSGIENDTDIDKIFNSLCDWKVVMKQDYSFLDKPLTYAFMSKTICNLLDEKGNPIDILANKGWISNSILGTSKVNENQAKGIVDKAISIINNKKFIQTYKYEYVNKPKSKEDELKLGDIVFNEKDEIYEKVVDINGNDYVYEDAQFEEVFSYFDIADSFEVDFSQVEVIPLQDEISDSSYVNNKYNLLASKNHVFNADGFRISYTLSTSGIDIHVSKKVDKTNIYADASIQRVKPSFKWTYDSGDIKNCYFNVTMNTTTTLGASIGKYGNYYVKLKDLDSSSFMSTIKSMIVPRSDQVEAIIPICQIKTPIPNVPFANLNMTIGIKLYVSGKIEVVLYDSHNVGMEIKNKKARFFYDHNDDLDAIIRSSGKSALALNIGLDASKFRLCDIEMDGGLKAEVKTTAHLYDTDFNEKEVSSDIEYSTLDEVSKNNPYVKICGDVSFYWLLDLVINTPKSLLSKWGFSKTLHILDDDNQVFGNLHHIENGQFVKLCTRKTKTAINNTNTNININSNNKILLNTYAEVLSVSETFDIEVIGLPKGYDLSNIAYTSSDTSIVKLEGNKIIAIQPGSAKIKVHTSDNKYNTYINILVSTG